MKKILLVSSLLLGVPSVAIGLGQIEKPIVARADASSNTTTVEQSTFSATSGDVGGDANVSYETGQGGAGTAPGIYSGVIRLYQNSAGTGGGFITIKANNETKITSVTIGSSMATSIAYTLDDSTDKSTTEALAKNGTKTIDGLDNESISFYCMGTTSSTRLYVNYLSVTYSSAVIENAIKTDFYMNDGTEDLYTFVTTEKGKNVEFPNSQPTRNGYIFIGWFTQKEGGDEVKTLTATKDVSLYAHWEEFSIKEGLIYTYDFTNPDKIDTDDKAFSSWTNSYIVHTFKYSEEDSLPKGTVLFDTVSKQTSNIANMPVGKGPKITFTLEEENFAIKSFELTCAQWTDKTQTISATYTGSNGTVSAGEDSSNFTFTSKDLTGENATKIEFSFNSTSNQVGIQSLAIVLEAKVPVNPVDQMIAEFEKTTTLAALGLNYGFDGENYVFANLRLYFTISFDYSQFENDVTETGICFKLLTDDETITVENFANPAVKTVENKNKEKEFIVELTAPETKEGVQAMFDKKFAFAAYVKFGNDVYLNTVRTYSFSDMLLEYSKSTDPTISEVAEEAWLYYGV